MQPGQYTKLDELPRAATWKFYAVMLVAVTLASIGLVGYKMHLNMMHDQSALLSSLAEQRLMIERFNGLARLIHVNGESKVVGDDQIKSTFAEIKTTAMALEKAARRIEDLLPKVVQNDNWAGFPASASNADKEERLRLHTQEIVDHTAAVCGLVLSGADTLKTETALAQITASYAAMSRATSALEEIVASEAGRQRGLQNIVLNVVFGSFIAILLIVTFGIFRPLMNDLRVQMEATVLSRRRMSYLANHDVLTGMPNRLKMRDSTQTLLARAQQENRKAGALLIDLDDFKPINDTYGHAAGDIVLKESAKRILQTVESRNGIGARIGGDEFAAALGDVPDVATLREFANEVSAALARPIDIGGRSVNVGCSIGASLFPDHGNDASKIYTSADRAMYVAKENGAKVCLYGDDLYNSVEHPERIRSVLVRALLNGEFEMHYQPAVRLADAKAVGAEALIRWRRPGQGLVSPAEFIPDAERTGAIIELTEFALNEALATWKDWQARDLFIDRIGVNIAEAVLAGPLSSIFQPLLERSDGDLSWLLVEVTESVFIDEAHEAIRERLDWLVEHGAQIALDDFGTGYASLAHLRSFPVHCLKIDRSFVMSLREDVNADAIVRSIIDLARNLKASVIAEGVETEAQRAFLLIDGCEVAQGFLFSKALPAEELFDLLAKRRNLDPLCDDTEAQLLRIVGANVLSS